MDLIYRQDVIELVKNSYYDLAESIEDTWAMVADVEKLPSAQPLTETDYTELRHRFGETVERVVRDMITGKGERLNGCLDKQGGGD